MPAPRDVLQIPESWLHEDGVRADEAIHGCQGEQSFLVRMLHEIYVVLPTDQQRNLRALGDKLDRASGAPKSLSLTTLCSGTDACVDVLKDGLSRDAETVLHRYESYESYELNLQPCVSFIQDILGFAWNLGQSQPKHPSELQLKQEGFIKHELSCDIDPKVREYILKTQNPRVLVADIKEVGDLIVQDLKLKSLVCVPMTTACVCSWVCHDL